MAKEKAHRTFLGSMVKVFLFLALTFLFSPLMADDLISVNHITLCSVSPNPDNAAPAWSREQKTTIDNLLNTYKTTLPNFFSKIESNGFKRICLKPMGMAIWNPVAIMDTKSFVIFLNSENFFIPNMDSSGFSFTEQSFLHELMHAFDPENVLSSSAEFIELTKMKYQDIYNDYRPSNLSSMQLEKNRYLAMKIYSEKGWVEARSFSRKTAMKYGFPTLYSMDGGLKESFAEIGSYIVLDPKAPTYIQPAIVKWFKTNVLN